MRSLAWRTDRVNETESKRFLISTISLTSASLPFKLMLSHTSSKCLPSASAIRMYSAPTGLLASLLKARTCGTGSLRTLRAWNKEGFSLEGETVRKKGPAHKIHRCNFRSNRMRNWTGIVIWNSGNETDAITHHQSKELTVTSLRCLFHRFAVV